MKPQPKILQTEVEEPRTYEIERQKNLVDYLKHLVTLSTGSIVVMATFLEKFPKESKYSFLIIISLIAFVISILGTLITHTIVLVTHPGSPRDMNKFEEICQTTGLVSAWIGFAVGIVTLAVYVMFNLP